MNSEFYCLYIFLVLFAYICTQSNYEVFDEIHCLSKKLT